MPARNGYIACVCSIAKEVTQFVGDRVPPTAWVCVRWVGAVHDDRRFARTCRDRRRSYVPVLEPCFPNRDAKPRDKSLDIERFPCSAVEIQVARHLRGKPISVLPGRQDAEWQFAHKPVEFAGGARLLGLHDVPEQRDAIVRREVRRDRSEHERRRKGLQYETVRALVSKDGTARTFRKIQKRAAKRRDRPLQIRKAVAEPEKPSRLLLRRRAQILAAPLKIRKPCRAMGSP